MTTTRVVKTFSVSVEAVEAMERRCKETGEKFSHLVERGIRLALALPPEEDEERSLAPTRSEVAALEVLKRLGPGSHLTYEIGNPAALSPGVAEKALRGLERRGECFCWGAGKELSDGTFSLAWGLVSPMAAVRQVMGSWKGEPDETLFSRIRLVRKLALAIDDVEPVRAFMAEVTELQVEDLAIENSRGRSERLNAAERARV